MDSDLSGGQRYPPLEQLGPGRLEDSGRQNNERKSRKIGNAQSRATFFRHSAVVSLPGVLLRKLPNN